LESPKDDDANNPFDEESSGQGDEDDDNYESGEED
jgi:hypothetical protein